jgi:hypothetical protein
VPSINLFFFKVSSPYIYYKFITATATLKNVKTEQESTIVVISGDAIIAGSNLNFFAMIGKTPPDYLSH